MTQAALIYQCQRGCTIAVPRDGEDLDEIVFVDSTGDAFPECNGCTEIGDRQDILWFGENDEIRLIRGACTFRSTEASHRNLIPHTCTCAQPSCVVSTPEKTNEHDTQPDEQPRVDAPVKIPWTVDEDATVRVCTSQEDAVSTYYRVHGADTRTPYAIKQRWLKHNREGTLVRPGLRCTICDTGPFYGSNGTVAGIADDKTAVNVATDDGAIYQVSAKYVEVEK